MDEILDILINLLPEFALPKPDINFKLIEPNEQNLFLFAWEKHKIGIKKGNNLKVQTKNNWQVFECFNQESAKITLKSIADLINNESVNYRIDFNNIQKLFDANQFDSARIEIDKIIQSLHQNHPDYVRCNKWIKELRIASKKNTSEQTQSIKIPEVSFPLQIKNDAANNISILSESYNFLGTYTPKAETNNTIDAIWLGIVRDGKIKPFVACVNSSTAYENDTNWQVFGSELELLDALLQKLETHPTFIWGTENLLPLINNWHYRLKGTFLKEIEFYDLEKIASVFSPLTHRTDCSESFCKQKNIKYTDNFGLGGTLAASISLLNHIVEHAHKLPEELKNAIKIVLSNNHKKNKNKLIFDDELNIFSSDYICQNWLELLLPTSTKANVNNYFESLKKYHLNNPSIIKYSNPIENNSKNNFCVYDFFKNNGFVSQVTKFAYSERKEQIALVIKLKNAINHQKHLLLKLELVLAKLLDI